MAKRGVTGFWFVAPFFVRALSRKVVMRGKGELAVFFSVRLFSSLNCNFSVVIDSGVSRDTVR